jgi:hypothetical protein
MKGHEVPGRHERRVARQVVVSGAGQRLGRRDLAPEADARDVDHDRRAGLDVVRVPRQGKDVLLQGNLGRRHLPR